MSESAYSVIAFLSVLAAVFSVWSAFRRRQIMRRILDSLTKEQREQLEKNLKKRS